MSEVGNHTSNINTTTLLIPEMNFTCNASIVGFTLAGRNLSNNFQIQIWRKNSFHNSTVYYQVGHSVSVIVLSEDVCLAVQNIVGNTFWCILRDHYQVSVQPGDILGLELPRTDDDGIWFTNGGPVNYEFDNQLDPDPNRSITVNLSSDGTPSYSLNITQQLPQIIFNLTSGRCY